MAGFFYPPRPRKAVPVPPGPPAGHQHDRLRSYVGASLEVMDYSAKKMCSKRLFVFLNLKTGQGLANIIAFFLRGGSLA